MAIQSAQDLFLRELSSVYASEQTILQTLPELAREVADDRVRSALQHHEQETRQQVQNLDQCFQLLGTQPQRVTPYPIEGLRQEHDEFVRQNPPPAILTSYVLGAAAKTEHLEIAAYRGLSEKATVMGQQECARLLQQNLRQEEEMARKVEQLGQQVGQQLPR